MKICLSFILDGEMNRRLLWKPEGLTEGRTNKADVIGLFVFDLNFDWIGKRIDGIILIYVFPFVFELVYNILNLFCIDYVSI